jgi:hypothetical protein
MWPLVSFLCAINLSSNRVSKAVKETSNGRVDFVDGWHITYICTKAINALWVDSWPRQKSNGRGKKSSGEESAKFTDLSLQVALGRVPCSQTSLFRSPLCVRKSGQVRSLPIVLHRSPFAGAKFTHLPLQIPLYRQIAKKK